MGVNKSADQQLHNRAQRSGAAPATLAGQLFRDDRDFQDAIAASLENQQGIDTIESVGLLAHDVTCMKFRSTSFNQAGQHAWQGQFEGGNMLLANRVLSGNFHGVLSSSAGGACLQDRHELKTFSS